MTDRSDAVVITYRVPRGPDVCDRRHRVRYEPRADGRWERITELWLGDGFDVRDRTVVSHLAVDAREVAADGR
jgi:hypothetical protein